MNAYAILTKAKQDLLCNPTDPMAKFIVDLWTASGNLAAQNKQLTVKNADLAEQAQSLKTELAAAKADNANYARKQDMLESALLREPGGKSSLGTFDAKSWAEAQYAMVVGGASAAEPQA